MNGLQALARMANEQPNPTGLMALASASVVEVTTARWYWWAYTQRPASSLEALAMQDRDFGWTIEMQVRAAKLGLRTIEVPTGYRRRIGISKISGTIDGVLKAGVKILYVIGREAFGDFNAARRKP